MGKLQLIHTPLVAWIADYPEWLLVSCISSKNSLILLANAKQFIAACNPCNIVTFHKFCLTKCNACPSHFLTPNALHQWHKFYFDHCLQWVINIIGVLQLRIGTRHWTNGISMLKQCTGCEHHDLEKVLLAVAAGALPDNVLCALQVIMEFIFLAQNLFHYNETIHALKEALCDILIADGHLGINGPLNHFQIPKLELAQHIVRSIYKMGAPYQWSSDITEWCHIMDVKTLYHLSNH
ncbi:hypothetical protein J3A83DRAFT_4360596 [Scleroderma citrinum]